MSELVIRAAVGARSQWTVPAGMPCQADVAAELRSAGRGRHARSCVRANLCTATARSTRPAGQHVGHGEHGLGHVDQPPVLVHRHLAQRLVRLVLASVADAPSTGPWRARPPCARSAWRAPCRVRRSWPAGGATAPAPSPRIERSRCGPYAAGSPGRATSAWLVQGVQHVPAGRAVRCAPARSALRTSGAGAGQQVLDGAHGVDAAGAAVVPDLAQFACRARPARGSVQPTRRSRSSSASVARVLAGAGRRPARSGIGEVGEDLEAAPAASRSGGATAAARPASMWPEANTAAPSARSWPANSLPCMKLNMADQGAGDFRVGGAVGRLEHHRQQAGDQLDEGGGRLLRA